MGSEIVEGSFRAQPSLMLRANVKAGEAYGGR